MGICQFVQHFKVHTMSAPANNIVLHKRDGPPSCAEQFASHRIFPEAMVRLNYKQIQKNFSLDEKLKFSAAFSFTFSAQ